MTLQPNDTIPENVDQQELEVLAIAVDSFTGQDNDEEEGGFILHNKLLNQYKYKLIKNQNTNTPVARVLWTADQYQFAKEILGEIKNGWMPVASIHTHPRFPALPSAVDLSELFLGFPTNYIYSPVSQLISKWSAKDKNEEPAGVFIIEDGHVIPGSSLDLLLSLRDFMKPSELTPTPEITPTEVELV